MAVLCFANVGFPGSVDVISAAPQTRFPGLWEINQTTHTHTHTRTHILVSRKPHLFKAGRTPREKSPGRGEAKCKTICRTSPAPSSQPA